MGMTGISASLGFRAIPVFYCGWGRRANLWGASGVVLGGFTPRREGAKVAKETKEGN
jgi:hypothetical protein